MPGLKLRIVFFCLMAFLLQPYYVLAGGSSETTLVVVNTQSLLSKRIANEYVHLRNIPQNHIIWLDDVPSMDTISINDFRKKIWSPIRDFIHAHQLDEEIDIISYSGDFPYAVNFTSDTKAKGLKRNIYLGKIASLTSLTYFAKRVEKKDIGYLGENYYFRDYAVPKIKTHSKHSKHVQKLNKKQLKRLKSRAKWQLNHKAPEQAEAYFQDIVNSHPEDPENWYNLSRSQAASSKWQKALRSLTKAVDFGWSNSLLTKREKYFKALHGDPEFRKLVHRMLNAYGPFLNSNGFRHHYVWSNADLAFEMPADALNQYYLSTMLAYTGERGNSFPEIMNYLKSAASSDASQPNGTVYLLENANIRSTTRQALFPVTLNELLKRGHKGEVLYKGLDIQDGVLPIAKTDVIGAVVGFPDFKWETTGSVLLPGAIAESLTSYGGHFHKPKQTKLSSFLRYGAAGSSGAVTEPYAAQEKFPVPMMHAWYAEGYSLSEAYYQSIKRPYQLIIVGDPLTRPFAKFADIRLKSPQLLSSWSKTVTIEAEIKAPPGKSIRKAEFWVDGQFLFDIPVNDSFSWDTQTIEDGNHEIRLVAIENSDMETRSSLSFQTTVFNHHQRIKVDPLNQPISYEDMIKITGTAQDAQSIEIFRGYEKLGSSRVNNSRWKIEIPAKTFGIGPVSFFVKASSQDGTTVRSPPVQVSIGMPQYLEPIIINKPSGSGLSAIVYDKKNQKHQLVIKQLNGLMKELHKNKITAKKIVLEGYFYVNSDGFYQLEITADGHLRTKINHQLMMDKIQSRRNGVTFLALNLKRGWYQLELDYKVHHRPFLKIVLSGDQIPMSLSGSSLGHSASLHELKSLKNNHL